jgi:hypothetical protein
MGLDTPVSKPPDGQITGPQREHTSALSPCGSLFRQQLPTASRWTCSYKKSFNRRGNRFAGIVAHLAGEGTEMCKRALAILTLVICSPGALAQNEPGSALQGMDRNDLCVTNGNVSVLSGGWLAIDTPSSRAVIRADGKHTADQVAEIHFRYLGPTQTSKPLASGELRRQIGLKLQAEDTCNLIYAMWHIEPDTTVAVSVKRNAGMHTHEQCRAGGYVNIKAQRRIDLPPIQPGQTHTLRAELHGNNLTVTADGTVAWYGSLGNEPLSLQGPTGFRTDNARFEFQYYAYHPANAQTRRGAPGPEQCLISEGD